MVGALDYIDAKVTTILEASNAASQLLEKLDDARIAPAEDKRHAAAALAYGADDPSDVRFRPADAESRLCRQHPSIDGEQGAIRHQSRYMAECDLSTKQLHPLFPRPHGALVVLDVVLVLQWLHS